MAFDPATAKAVAKAASGVLTNKESRSNLLYIILIALAVCSAVILMPIYILTQPTEMLNEFFANNPDEAEYARQFKEENDGKVLTIGEGLIAEGVYPFPVINAAVTNSYGEMQDALTGVKSFHYGTDFDGAWRSEIYSVADGVAIKVCTEKNDDYGNYIIIKHTGVRTDEDGTEKNETFYALYGYMNEIYMYEGQSVKKGALIGVMGGDPKRDKNPGQSTKTHLHFEIRNAQDGLGIDPTGYIFPLPDETAESEENTNE